MAVRGSSAPFQRPVVRQDFRRAAVPTIFTNFILLMRAQGPYVRLWRIADFAFPAVMVVASFDMEFGDPDRGTVAISL
jgi:hypothetical protein